MKPFQFLTIRPALIIGVQFKLQNLYYFGLSATNFPSLDVKILTTSVWVRHLFPHWTCRRVEEISNAPRVRNTLVYSSREDLEIFGSSEIGFPFESMRCLAVWSRELHMGRDVEECLSENPRRETGILPPAASPGAGPCVSECLSRVPRLVLVSSTWAQHRSQSYESPRCQHHLAVDRMVSPWLSCPPLHRSHSCLLPQFLPS